MSTDNAVRHFQPRIQPSSHDCSPATAGPRAREAEPSIDPSRHRRGKPRGGEAAFTRVDLLGLLVAGALVFGVLSPLLAGTGPAGGRTQCLSNLRKLMLASQLYAGDNRDFMPFPTWGSDMTGADGWAYATANRGRLPGQPVSAPARSREAQKPWRTIGQLWPYVNEGTAYECPDDLITQDPGSVLFLARSCQITSYQMNAMMAGLPEDDIGSSGRTYPITRFLPSDVVFMECSESEAFYFNDAGINPEGEGAITTRHGGLTQTVGETQPATVRDRGGHVGRIDGGAEFIDPANFARESNPALQKGRRTRIICYPWK